MIASSMIKRILIVDDLQVRHDAFSRLLPARHREPVEIVHAWTSDEAIALLRQSLVCDIYVVSGTRKIVETEPEPFDVVWLDHDDEVHGTNYMAVANFITAMQSRPVVCVHSTNQDGGAARMIRRLRQAGVTTQDLPFNDEQGVPRWI